MQRKKNYSLCIKRQTACSFFDEDDIDFDINTFKRENDFFNNKKSLDKWKLFKGVAELWFGSKLFFVSSQRIVFLLMSPDNVWSKVISSSTKNAITDRPFWLFVSSTLTVFSLWILKNAAINLHEGLCPTVDTIEVF